MQWLKKERCKVCREERAVRYCLRRNKDMGWACCNSYRADGKCPEACPYTPKADSDNSLLPMLKSDSRNEFLDYLDRYLQFWIYKTLPELDNISAYDLCQDAAGKARFKDWLSGFNFQDNGILALLNKKLDLSLAVPEEKLPNLETLSLSYLDAAIAQNWDAVAGFYTHSHVLSLEAITYYTKQLMSHPLLRKVKSRTIINSGFTQDLKQAFVLCEINGKENWTFIFAGEGTTWQLFQTIWGTLQDYYNEKTLFREIAVAISQKDESALFQRLDSIQSIYPLSADLQYYWGLYYNLCNRIDEVKTAFQNAILIEPTWPEPIFQLAFLYMNLKEFSTAISYWEKLAEYNPNDVNVQNNIGVCFMGLNVPEQAKEVWEKALMLDPTSEILKKNLEHLQHG